MIYDANYVIRLCKFDVESQLMPKTIFFLLCLTLSFCSFGQDKVEWAANYDSQSESITFSAKIEEGWHVYGQNINESLGPVPTTFEFEKNNKKFKLIGKTIEPTPITKYDKNFEGELSYFENSVQFVQKLKVKSSADVNIKLTYMVCNEDVCLPPRNIDFNLKIIKNEK